MKKLLILFLVVISKAVVGQDADPIAKDRKFYIGSTLFVLYNFIDDPEPPNVYQLNLGYRFSEKDAVSVELITWNYYEPIGVPLVQKSTAPNYPGKVISKGAGIAYQRFFHRGFYTQVHATLFRQDYRSEDTNENRKGWQMFNTLRAGYQFRFFEGRFFIEPSLAMTFWPINTNLPASYLEEENKWNKYFLGEPGLHVGFNF